MSASTEKPLKGMKSTNILGKIIEISHSNLEIASRINAILNIISQQMAFEEVIVYTLDKDKHLSCRFMNRGSRLFDVLTKYRCRVGEGVVGTVAQKRAPQFFTIKDVPARFGCLFYADLDKEALRYRTFSFFPLADDSFLYGVLLVCSSEKEALPDSDNIMLSIISRELGGVLRTYDLLLSSKKRISELATLSELGKVLTSATEPRLLLQNIALITARALNALFTTIKLEPAFIRLDGQRFTSGMMEPAMEGPVSELEGQAMQLRRSASLAEFAPPGSGNSAPLSLYSTPIISKERILGTMTLCRKREPNDLTAEDDEQYLVTTIANYIASGLENSLLSIRLRDVLKELGDAQRRLIENEKLRSLGEMTANIAHEIKNPLVIIGGFTRRLSKKINLDDKENRYVDIILKEVARLEAILNEILNYVKETPLLLETCSVNLLLDEVLYLLTSDRAWEGISIAKEYDENDPSTTCDVQQIKQVLINILINAFEAMEGQGTITLKTEKTTYQEHPFVSISLTDTGGGADPAVLDNIFNPFFTTKEKGSGLGLAISNKIIMHHRGRIEVKNKAGEGVTFIIYLPETAN